MNTERPTPLSTRPPEGASDRQRIRDENIRLHEALAGDYDRIHPHMRNAFEQRMQDRDMRAMLEAVTREAPGPLVLDIGCGTGNLTVPFVRAGCRVTAVDMSRAMLDVLGRKLVAIGAPPDRYTLVQSDAEAFVGRLAGDAPRWSIAAMSSVAHHLHDYLSVLEMLASSIVPTGFLYLVHEPAHKLEMNRRAIWLRQAWSVLPRGLDRVGRWTRSNAERTAWADEDTTYVDYHYHRDGISVRDIGARLAPLGFGLVDHTRYNAHETDVASWLDNVIAPRFRYEQFQRTYFRAIWQRQR